MVSPETCWRQSPEGDTVPLPPPLNPPMHRKHVKLLTSSCHLLCSVCLLFRVAKSAELVQNIKVQG